MLCTSAVEYIPQVSKEKHPFLSDLSTKSSISMCSICIITKGYKVFLWKLCQSKYGVCEESPPKRWTVAETFAWRLRRCSSHSLHKPWLRARSFLCMCVLLPWHLSCTGLQYWRRINISFQTTPNYQSFFHWIFRLLPITRVFSLDCFAECV